MNLWLFIGVQSFGFFSDTRLSNNFADYLYFNSRSHATRGNEININQLSSLGNSKSGYLLLFNREITVRAEMVETLPQISS